MENLLFYTDLHIDKNSLEECKLILDEIASLIKEHNITKVINLGDSFDTLKPSSIELDLFSQFVTKINIPIIVLAANSHESSTNEDSVLNHFGILNNNITVVKEYIDGDLYCGHFIVSEAKKGMGSTVSKKDLEKYTHVLLGHQHDFEKIKPNCVQLGSCRFVDFGEDPSIKKKVAICLDYKGEHEKWGFLDLKSPYPAVNIEVGEITELKKSKKGSKEAISAPKNASIPETSDNTDNEKESKIAPINPSNLAEIKALCEKLDKLDKKTKVRVIFKDYSLWREFLPFYQAYKDKFVIFVDKKDFIINIDVVKEKNKDISIKNSFIKFLEVNKVEDKIKNILLEEIK